MRGWRGPLRWGPEREGKRMRILLIASAYNSMTQRAQVELAERGHEVSVELAVAGEVLRDGSGAMARTWSWRRC
jgi:hypothetical protein